LCPLNQREVAEKECVRKAAITLVLKQPTVSRQIQLLEKELAVILFDCSSVKMRITPEGKAVQMEAIPLFEDIKPTVFTFHADITVE
jgi:DNA-binding transcriptional LysR family regulator